MQMPAENNAPNGPDQWSSPISKMHEPVWTNSPLMVQGAFPSTSHVPPTQYQANSLPTKNTPTLAPLRLQPIPQHLIRLPICRNGRQSAQGRGLRTTCCGPDIKDTIQVNRITDQLVDRRIHQNRGVRGGSRVVLYCQLFW